MAQKRIHETAQMDLGMQQMSGPKNATLFKLDVILFESPEGIWSAQCLQYDIAAQARTFQDILYEFERVVVSHIALNHEEGKEAFAGIKPAPDEFWALYDESPTSITRRPSPFRVDNYSPAMPIVEMRYADHCGTGC